MGAFRLTSTQVQAIVHLACVVLQVYVAPKHPEFIPAIALLQGAFGVALQDKK